MSYQSSSMTYISRDINGIKDELVLKQEKNDNDKVKQQFIAKKQKDGQLVKVLRGKRREKQWLVMEDDNFEIVEKPTHEFDPWFDIIDHSSSWFQSPFHLLSSAIPLVKSQSSSLQTFQSQYTDFNHFDHDFFKE